MVSNRKLPNFPPKSGNFWVEIRQLSFFGTFFSVHSFFLYQQADSPIVQKIDGAGGGVFAYGSLRLIEGLRHSHAYLATRNSRFSSSQEEKTG